MGFGFRLRLSLGCCTWIVAGDGGGGNTTLTADRDGAIGDSTQVTLIDGTLILVEIRPLA